MYASGGELLQSSIYCTVASFRTILVRIRRRSFSTRFSWFPFGPRCDLRYALVACFKESLRKHTLLSSLRADAITYLGSAPLFWAFFHNNVKGCSLAFIWSILVETGCHAGLLLFSSQSFCLVMLCASNLSHLPHVRTWSRLPQEKKVGLVSTALGIRYVVMCNLHLVSSFQAALFYSSLRIFKLTTSYRVFRMQSSLSIRNF